MELRVIGAFLACLFVGQAWGAFDLTAFAKEREELIAKASAMERTPRGALRREVIQRNDYERALVKQRTAMIRSGELTTPEVEALRKQREALVAQLIDLDKAIEAASEKAPEIVELDAVRKANAERLESVKAKLSPPAQPNQEQDVKPQTE